MSAALENVTLNGAERRNASRLRIGGTIGVRIGRGEGVLIDVSDRGARVRHQSVVVRGAAVRITFDFEGARFTASAEVLASRVVSLGRLDGTTYETRLRFTLMDGDSAAVLARMLEAVAGRDMRRWVANLRGWDDGAVSHEPRLTTGSFLRCRLLGRRWEQKWTQDTTQPADGFLLPGGIEEGEIRTLCDTYESLDAEGRRVVRLMAAAAVEQAGEGQAA